MPTPPLYFSPSRGSLLFIEPIRLFDRDPVPRRTGWEWRSRTIFITKMAASRLRPATEFWGYNVITGQRVGMRYNGRSTETDLRMYGIPVNTQHLSYIDP